MEKNVPQTAELATPEEIRGAIEYRQQVGAGWASQLFTRGAAKTKTIYTLNIDNYEPAICDLTYPFLKHYAKKIGADFQIITQRRFPHWPVTYEKLQVADFARENGDEWAIFIDSDTLINPEFFDVTDHLSKDTVCHNGRDMNGIRWKMDPYFRRDGRWIGSCNWFAVASDWCLDLWNPIEDLTPEQAIERISITINEHNSGYCKREHLIDDFTLSRNIARFGLKFRTVSDICGELGWKDQFGRGASPFLWHQYAISTEEKLNRMLAHLSAPQDKGGWALMTPEMVMEFKKKWGLK